MTPVPEAPAIVNALRSGLVPAQGLEHFATGLEALVEAVNQELDGSVREVLQKPLRRMVMVCG